jgi:hypothetical protein
MKPNNTITTLTWANKAIWFGISLAVVGFIFGGKWLLGIGFAVFCLGAVVAALTTLGRLLGD